MAPLSQTSASSSKSFSNHDTCPGVITHSSYVREPPGCATAQLHLQVPGGLGSCRKPPFSSWRRDLKASATRTLCGRASCQLAALGSPFSSTADRLQFWHVLEVLSHNGRMFADIFITRDRFFSVSSHPHYSKLVVQLPC